MPKIETFDYIDGVQHSFAEMRLLQWTTMSPLLSVRKIVGGLKNPDRFVGIANGMFVHEDATFIIRYYRAGDY